jgi:patatin-like phospholipase/acyl hydrolase
MSGTSIGGIMASALAIPQKEVSENTVEGS